jgi:hypothetical protein
MNWRALPVIALVAAAVVAPSPAGAAARSCKPVVDPYAGTRYEGTNLRGIKARSASCTTARRVARGAHRKALGFSVPADGIRRFTWHAWKVTGNLRGSTDRYLATKGRSRVRWLF